MVSIPFSSYYAIACQLLDHMLVFIYLAYSMMALLYETVPTFEDTWIECLVILVVTAWPLRTVASETEKSGPELQDTGIPKHQTRPPRPGDCTIISRSWHALVLCNSSFTTPNRCLNTARWLLKLGRVIKTGEGY